MSAVCPCDAVAEQLALVRNTLDQLLAGQAALAEQQAQILRILADTESVNPDRLYSRADAARLLSVHVKTIDRWIHRGILARVVRGRRTYITGRSIQQRHHAERRRAAVEVLKI